MPSLIESIILPSYFFLFSKQFYESFSIFYQGVVTFDFSTYVRCYMIFWQFFSISTQIFSLAMKIDLEKKDPKISYFNTVALKLIQLFYFKTLN
jgi:hypothetical protein